ncbi:MAG TPA: YSC84-related protein [Polyangia bacterium]|jgi:lipid-binding SYLF domain-containing protein|nr:YSC84-related protein [Polyangia bacterium]HWE28334.1 YSC84-related protein [Polyangia bacterium]
MRATIGLFVMLSLGALGCAHVPTQPGARADLHAAARQTLHQMEQRDPTLRPLIADSAGYIVFPVIGQGGFLIGGGSGAGVAYEANGATHFAELSHLDAGALAGGQRYAEVVVVRDEQTLAALREGRYDFGATASAVILHSGAAKTASFDRKGVAVFVSPIRGAMVNASVSGQHIKLTL